MEDNFDENLQVKIEIDDLVLEEDPIFRPELNQDSQEDSGYSTPGKSSNLKRKFSATTKLAENNQKKPKRLDNSQLLEQKPDEITPVLEKKQKLTKCDVCNDFAKLQEFSQFEKKAIKGHIMWVHEGKLQCKACDNEYALDKEKPIEMYDPTMFLCPNCLLSEDLPQIHRREPKVVLLPNYNYEYEKSPSGYVKPPLKYASLVTLALKSKRDYCMSVEEMNKFIINIFPFYAYTKAEWTIQRQLTRENFFKHTGRGNLWSFGNEEKFSTCCQNLKRQFYENEEAMKKSSPMFGFLEKIVHGTNDFDAKYENVCQKPMPNPKKDFPVVEKPAIVDLDGYYETLSQNNKDNITKPMWKFPNGESPGIKNRRNYRVQGGLNNNVVITLALCNSQSGYLRVTDIYEFINEHFPRMYQTPRLNWQSTIRHSLLKCDFMKTERPQLFSEKKGKFIYSINPSYIKDVTGNAIKSCQNYENEAKGVMANPDMFGQLLSKVIEFRRNGGPQQSLDTSDLSNGSSEKKSLDNIQKSPLIQENLRNLENGVSDAVGCSIAIKPVTNDKSSPSNSAKTPSPSTVKEVRNKNSCLTMDESNQDIRGSTPGDIQTCSPQGNDQIKSSTQRSQTETETEEDEMIATYDFKQNTVPSSELSSPSALSDLTRFGLNLDSKLRVHGNMDRTKPELTLQLLITLALKAKKNRQCTIEELMKIIGSMFPYFKKSQNIIGWKKDLTSTLSDATKNKPFVRLTNQTCFVWTFSNKSKAEELDKRLRLNVGSILCKSFARIKEATPMPDIIKQIVDEEIELPGYPLQALQHALPSAQRPDPSELPKKSLVKENLSPRLLPPPSITRDAKGNPRNPFPGVLGHFSAPHSPAFLSITSLTKILPSTCQNPTFDYEEFSKDNSATLPKKSVGQPLQSPSEHLNPSNMADNVGNVYEKPLLTNADMIVLALKSNKDMAMALNDIYTFIKKMFPYFKDLEKNKWQNQLRHALTTKAGFVQDITKVCQKNGSGRKSCAWTFKSEEDVQKMSKQLLKRFGENFQSILDATPAPNQAYLQQLAGQNETSMASLTLYQPWQFESQMKPVESKMNPSESPVTASKLPSNPTNPEKSQKRPQKKRSNAAYADPEKSVNKHARPLPNFTQLIVLAMINKADGQCFCSDIYKFISDNFPYYDLKGNREGWKNSVRHSLSTGNFFEKKEMDSSGWRPRYSWGIIPDRLEKEVEEVIEYCLKYEVQIRKSLAWPDLFEELIDMSPECDKNISEITSDDKESESDNSEN